MAIMMRGFTTISKMTFSKMAKLQLSGKHFCMSNDTSFIVLLNVVLLSVVMTIVVAPKNRIDCLSICSVSELFYH
jgi:hypothetical protein